MMQFKGKTALITGSKQFQGDSNKAGFLGANIVLNDIPSSEALDDAEELRKSGIKYSDKG